MPMLAQLWHFQSRLPDHFNRCHCNTTKQDSALISSLSIHCSLLFLYCTHIVSRQFKSNCVWLVFCNSLCVLLWLEGDHKFIVAAATFSSFCWHRGANSAVLVLALQYENQPQVFLYIAKKAIRHQHLGTTIKVFLLLTSDFGRWPS